ncbi:MAG TPA: DUF4249 domain-containing protein, partial [Mucilaginibacter sp.]|nr:DUF4249 domain-containing protein [Mucilaginibacter sp.]
MRKLKILVWMIFLALACKKPFTPPSNISDNNKYLVIEGVISGNDSTFIKLSRTKKIDTLRTVYPEGGAQISIESDANNNFSLTEVKTGTYAAASFNLDGTHKYRLRIKTSDGKEYVSDFVPVKNAPPIDSVGFAAHPTGVQVYVNAHDAANATRYYRWEFTEDWQFHSKYNSTYHNNKDPRAVSDQIYYCFSNDSSTNVVLASTTKLVNDVIYQAP